MAAEHRVTFSGNVLAAETKLFLPWLAMAAEHRVTFSGNVLAAETKLFLPVFLIVIVKNYRTAKSNMGLFFTVWSKPPKIVWAYFPWFGPSLWKL
jgi:hypothetical protein